MNDWTTDNLKYELSVHVTGKCGSSFLGATPFENAVLIFFTSVNSESLYCEMLEARSHFISRLSMIVRLNVVLNRTVVVESD